jgi:hypothetical protein
LNKYRRIEVNAYRRRVTVISGELHPANSSDTQPSQTDDEVSLNDSDLGQHVEPDSREGQLLLVEAVRSLQRRLSPEAMALIETGEKTLDHNLKRNAFYLWRRSISEFIPRAFRFVRREKRNDAGKRSVEN